MCIIVWWTRVCLLHPCCLLISTSSCIYRSNLLNERGVPSMVICPYWSLWLELLPNITKSHPTSISKHTEPKLQKIKLNEDIGWISPPPPRFILTHTISFVSQALNATKWTIFGEPLSHLIILLTQSRPPWYVTVLNYFSIYPSFYMACLVFPLCFPLFKQRRDLCCHGAVLQSSRALGKLDRWRLIAPRFLTAVLWAINQVCSYRYVHNLEGKKAKHIVKLQQKKKYS